MNVAGITPREVVEPQSVAELADCAALLYAHDRSFAFVGGGTDIELGNAPRSLDTLIRTTACKRVIDYAPQDQTVSVEAGMTLHDLGVVLAREGQFLAIDPPDDARTTVGGAVATNVYGRRRLRYGAIRDVIVGVEMVRPDGTRARGGGKVVKNVAGFDMPKLMVGSLGSLGAIVSATFRVHPIEERRDTLVYRGLSVESMMDVCRELTRAALVPAAVTACTAPGADRYDCAATFEGFARGVEQQMDAAKSIAVRLGLEADGLPPGDSTFEDRENSVRTQGIWRLTISAQPTALARSLADGLFASTSACVVYPMLGTAFVAAEELDAPSVERWRAALGSGTVTVNVMPHHARGRVDTWGVPLPAAFAIMRRLKQNFDPKGLCNAGRFVGGL